MNKERRLFNKEFRKIHLFLKGYISLNLKYIFLIKIGIISLKLSVQVQDNKSKTTVRLQEIKNRG